jgi:hypothetical protein
MKTFFYVLQKCIKSKQIIYPDEPFKPFLIEMYDKDFLDISSYIYSIIYDIYYLYLRSNIKNLYLKMSHAKLVALNTFLNNIFISNELKEKILRVFCEAQRIYFTFSKMANTYRYQTWPLIVTNDLTLNPLDINHAATFVLLQNKSRYLFSMHDLINIIETAICNAPNFFCSPLSPKNPYNNQKFNTSTLCNIYFKMKEGVCKFSSIIHLFFLECFIKQNFYINNEPFLREYSIKKYVYTSPSQTLYNAVKIMLHTNYHTNKLIIHEEFPKDMLVDIFRPYLFYYYVIHYSIKGTEKIHKYKKQLHIKLRQFYEYNNLFGRKICIGSRRKINKRPFSFKYNSEHINFYNIAVNNSKCEFELKINLTNPVMARLNRILHEHTTLQYDPDELFFFNEPNNEEYNTDYDDDE